MKVGARFYEPMIGRWIQKDPILSGFNWWVYCENDPVNGVDPEGKFAFLPALAPVALYVMIGAAVAFLIIEIVRPIIISRGRPAPKLPHPEPMPPNPNFQFPFYHYPYPYIQGR